MALQRLSAAAPGRTRPDVGPPSAGVRTDGAGADGSDAARLLDALARQADREISEIRCDGAGQPPARRFVAIEDWANGGEPLPFALGEQLFERLYGADVTGRGAWAVGGIAVCADHVRGPIMEFASASDAIVPLACSPDLPGRQVLASGHVGMVVGSSGPKRLWPMLKDWILSHETPN